jgi:hypothetical protein
VTKEKATLTGEYAKADSGYQPIVFDVSLLNFASGKSTAASSTRRAISCRAVIIFSFFHMLRLSDLLFQARECSAKLSGWTKPRNRVEIVDERLSFVATLSTSKYYISTLSSPPLFERGKNLNTTAWSIWGI